MTDESRKMFEKVRAFLTVYMPKQRGLSSHTIKSYKQSINQFLTFIKEKKHTRRVGMNDDRRGMLDHVRGRIDWIDDSLKDSRLSDSDLLDMYIDDLEYARKLVDMILEDEKYSYENMRGPSENVFESLSAQEDLSIALKALDTLIVKVKAFKEKYSMELSREYNEKNKEERDKIAIKLRRLMNRYISRAIEHLKPYSLMRPY